jgi:anti-sigma28 factor (negative regulator of flagellin synthesis)
VQDKVSVSTVDSAAIEAARTSVSDSRSTRVQEVVNAVRSGQYYPSPQQIAQKLVSEAEVEARLRALLAK